MSAAKLHAYEVLKSKLDEQEATMLIDYIDHKTEEKINQKKDIFLKKLFRSNLK